MQKTFWSNLILIVLLNVLVKPFYLFGIDAQIQNTVGAEDYGMYFALLNFSFLFNILLDIGITNYNTKNIAEHPNTISRYIGSILGVKVVLGFSYAAITIGVALILDYGDLQMKLLGILVFNQFLVSIILYFRSNFAGLHLFKIDALLSVLDRTILIVICLLLLYTTAVDTPFQISWFVYAQTVAYGSTVLIGLLLTIWKIGIPKLKINKLFTYAILRKSTPYALLILLMMLYSRIDAVMLERLLEDGKTQAGIYAQGFRLLDAVNIFALLVAGLLLPIFARLIKEKASVSELLQTSSKLLIGISILIGLGGCFYAYELMDFIYHQERAAASIAFPWIILSFVPMASTYVFGTLLTANGSLKELNIMALSGVGINIALNLILIPSKGAEGAAIATVSTQTFTALWQIFLTLKIFKLNVVSRDLIRMVIFTLSLFVAFFMIEQFFSNNYFKILSYFIFGTISLFSLKLINLKELFIIIKSKSV